VIRVVALVTGGSDLRPTEIAVEVADRDSPDLTLRLLAALRSEIERRRCSVPGAPPAAPDDSPEVPVVVEPDA
jgi:hypothetical protein